MVAWIDAKEIAPDTVLAWVYLNEPEKSTNAERFVVSDKQLDFLKLMVTAINSK